MLLTGNSLIKSSDGLCRFWITSQAQDYWPISNATLWGEWRLWEMNPAGYRVSNLLLHVVESLLVWIALRKISVPGAFLAALIFAVHPVNVEAVAWISQRKDMMAVLFFLLSIVLYLKSEMQPPREKQIRRPLLDGLYWLTLAAFFGGHTQQGVGGRAARARSGNRVLDAPLTRRDIVRIALFFVLGEAMACVNVWFQTHGAEKILRIAGFTERLLGRRDSLVLLVQGSFALRPVIHLSAVAYSN